MPHILQLHDLYDPGRTHHVAAAHVVRVSLMFDQPVPYTRVFMVGGDHVDVEEETSQGGEVQIGVRAREIADAVALHWQSREQGPY